MRKAVKSKKIPQPRGPYSPAIIADGFVFVAGQGSINPTTNEFELGDIRSETRRTLENIKTILQAAGSSLRDVVRVGVFLSDMKNFAAMNEVYAEFFPKDQPARTTVGVNLPKIKVEIDCIARVSKSRKRK
ncbi:MAG: RidA family protein [Acidobacteria bacterium]|nr:RidA family protein [Acidobacteriota bacterium]